MLNDLRIALRSLRRTPGFTTIAVVTLAVGIGANTAIFSVVNGVVLQALPYHEPSRLVWITETDAPHGTDLAVDPPMLHDWRADTHTLSAIAGWSLSAPAITGDGTAVRQPGADVNAELFPLLGVTPELGRWIQAADDRAGAAPVVVISDALWRERFGGDRAVLGRRLTLDNKPYTVIGVARPGFNFPDGARVWTPLIPALGDGVTIRGAHYLGAVGRLAPGATAEAATRELAAIARNVASTAPDARGVGARVEDLQDHLIRGSRGGLLVLLAAVACVLLVACANVANLTLARGIGRRRELAVRTSLGATPAILARQLLIESLTVALVAGVVGAALADASLGGILAISGPEIPSATTVVMNSRVLLFALGAATSTGVLFGIAPALHAARTDPQAALKEGGGGTTGGRLRRGLVIGQLTTTVVLLAAGALMVESFVKLTRTDPGFVADHVVAAKIALPAARYPDRAEQEAFFETLRERLAARPSVRVVAIARNLPVSGTSMTSPVWVVGQPITPRPPQGQYAPVSPEYFRTLGIPLLAGRGFTTLDDPSHPAVAIISAVLGKSLFGARSPIGAELKTGFDRAAREIVGVVGDVRHAGQASPPAQQVYVPFRQAVEPYETVVLDGPASERVLMNTVRNAVWQIDPDLPLDQLTTMNALLSASVARPRFYLTLLGGFALVALGLAALGVYGVINYEVARRTREIGLRVTLGAERRDVVRLVVAGALRIGGTGVLLGLTAALVVTRLLRSLLYHVTATDPVALGAAMLLLLATSALASYVPARRAARVDPMEALRYE